MEKKVNYIPAVRSRIEKKVGIYCRVSTNDMQQLNCYSKPKNWARYKMTSIFVWKQ